MAWKEVTKMSQKLEFVKHAIEAKERFSLLCARFNISRKTGYKILKRYEEEGLTGLEERSRRPHTTPEKTDSDIENKILSIREKKPTWGSRKIRRRLLDLGGKNLPATSTITDILHRNGKIAESEKNKRTFIRFEHDSPNDLWQMDFKGHFEIGVGRCSPLTVVDDHSRFAIGLRACGRQTSQVVKDHLIDIFRRYGLPLRINVDNGVPWAAPGSQFKYTNLSIWLIRLGIRVSYSRIRHPQTNGKDERFHRTLKSELLQFHYFKTLSETQRYFDNWRQEYNFERPHDSLNLDTPSSRYQMSKREYPENLPTVEYRSDDIVRKVDVAGKIGFRGKYHFLSEALRGEYVAVRENKIGRYEIYFCDQRIKAID